MITGNVIEGLLYPVRATRTDHQSSEIAHDLKNCMSALLYWVETLEANRDFPVANENSIEDLRKLIDKMNYLIERLGSL
jgi:signal transduction histidine kinase